MRKRKEMLCTTTEDELDFLNEKSLFEIEITKYVMFKLFRFKLNLFQHVYHRKMDHNGGSWLTNRQVGS